MQGCECKQTAGKFKASCGKTAMSFSKYFDTLYPPAKKKLIGDIDPYATEDDNFT